MVAIPIKIRVIVDPCGRVLVHEVEKLAPGEAYRMFSEDGSPLANQPPERWHDAPGCVIHTFVIDVPAPHIATPRITMLPEVERK